MNKRNKIFCFTHYDLDGVISFLTLKWFLNGVDINVMPLGSINKRENIQKWLLNNSFDSYERIFFLDLDVSDIADIIDNENVFIIDHHKSHDSKIYKRARHVIKEYSSACLLVYKTFKRLMVNKNFTDAQKKLIIYGDDYDSYNHKFPESRMLNMLFWGLQGAFNTFVELFEKGFRKFTQQELNIIRAYREDYMKIIHECELYGGIFKEKNRKEPWDIVALAHAITPPNEVSDYVLKKYKPDMCIMINLTTKHVGLRRRPDSNVNLIIFAEKYLNGGGHEYSAGGVITDQFLKFLENLHRI